MNPILEMEKLGEIDQVCHLDSCIYQDGGILDEVPSCIQRVLSAFIHLRHLSPQRTIRLAIKDRVFASAVRSVLLYRSEVGRCAKTVDVELRCPRNFGRVCWGICTNNA